MLAACQSYSVRGYIPVALKTKCPDLVQLGDGSRNGVIRHLVEVYDQYHECRARHDALVEIINDK